MTDQAVTLMFVVVVIFIIFLIFSKIHPSMFVCVVIFIIILVMLFNVRHCHFLVMFTDFGHIQSIILIWSSE